MVVQMGDIRPAATRDANKKSKSNSQQKRKTEFVVLTSTGRGWPPNSRGLPSSNFLRRDRFINSTNLIQTIPRYYSDGISEREREREREREKTIYRMKKLSHRRVRLHWTKPFKWQIANIFHQLRITTRPIANSNSKHSRHFLLNKSSQIGKITKSGRFIDDGDGVDCNERLINLRRKLMRRGNVGVTEAADESIGRPSFAAAAAAGKRNELMPTLWAIKTGGKLLE